MSSAAVSAMKQLGATKIDRDMASSVGSVGGGYEMDNLRAAQKDSEDLTTIMVSTIW